eukprot:1193589-Prorocentrum_minimum.AAC.2
MAGTIYATLRKYDKSLHNHSNVLRARAEKHAEKLAAARGDPRQNLRVAGVRCKIYNDIVQHKAIEALEGGIPWNGHEDNIIDRFDGRALLDFYREPVNRPPREKDEEEQELEDKLNFESYRDLVKLLRRKVPEETALLEVEKREIEERAQKEYERSLPKEKNKDSKPESAFAAVGFSYAASSGSGGHHAGNDKSEDDYSSHSSDEDSTGSDSDSSDGGASGSDEDEELGNLAKEFDIPSFRRMARRDKQEEKEREDNPHNPRYPLGRPSANPLGSRRQICRYEDTYARECKQSCLTDANIVQSDGDSVDGRLSPAWSERAPIIFSFGVLGIGVYLSHIPNLSLDLYAAAQEDTRATVKRDYRPGCVQGYLETGPSSSPCRQPPPP